MKKTIVHFIYDLGKSGAETMVVTAVNELKEYNNIVVTMNEKNHFKKELEGVEYICINTPRVIALPFAVIKFRKLLKKYQPDIVHVHLYWPMIVARLATPRKIPLIATIHAFIQTSMEYKAAYIRYIDRLTYPLRKNIIIAVAKGALDEYFSFLQLKPYKAYYLHTFVDTRIFNNKKDFSVSNGAVFKMVSVAAIRIQKNQQYFVEAFKQLKNDAVELHIYGSGSTSLQLELEKLLAQNNISNIKFMGAVNNLNELVPQYDLFTMCSTFEGFSLAVLEGMALQMPMLLSDIASFREQCEGTAEYFDLKNVDDFVNKLRKLKADKSKLEQMGKASRERALADFTQDHYMAGLRNIYTESLQN